MGELIGQAEPLNFKIKTFSNPSCNGILIGNSGLHFLNEGDDWTWHYQPDGSSGSVVGKELEYTAVFLAAFGEFMNYWEKHTFSKGNKPEVIQSLTNPSMAHFITEEFTEGIIRTSGNSCNIIFDVSTINASESLLAKFALAGKRCIRQAYQMMKV